MTETPAPTAAPTSVPTSAPTTAPTDTKKPGGFNFGEMFSNPTFLMILLGGGAAGFALGGNLMWAAIAGIGGALAYAAFGQDKKIELAKSEANDAQKKTEENRTAIALNLERGFGWADEKRVDEEVKKATTTLNGLPKDAIASEDNKKAAETIKAMAAENIKTLEATTAAANATIASKDATEEQKTKAQELLIKTEAAKVKFTGVLTNAVGWIEGTKKAEGQKKAADDLTAAKALVPPAQAQLKAAQDDFKTADEQRQKAEQTEIDKAKEAIKALQVKAADAEKKAQEAKAKANEVAANVTATEEQRKEATTIITSMDAVLRDTNNEKQKASTFLKQYFPAEATQASEAALPATLVIAAMPYSPDTIPEADGKLKEAAFSAPLSNKLEFDIGKDKLDAIRARYNAEHTKEYNRIFASESGTFTSDSTARVETERRMQNTHVSSFERFKNTYLNVSESVNTGLIYFTKIHPVSNERQEGFMRLSGHYEGEDFVADKALFFTRDNKPVGEFSVIEKSIRLKDVNKADPSRQQFVALSDANKNALTAIVETVATGKSNFVGYIAGKAPTKAMIETGLPRRDVSDVSLAPQSAAITVPVAMGDQKSTEIFMEVKRGENAEVVKVLLEGDVNLETKTMALKKATIIRTDPKTKKDMAPETFPIPDQPPVKITLTPDAATNPTQYTIGADQINNTLPTIMKPILSEQAFKIEKLPSINELQLMEAAKSTPAAGPAPTGPASTPTVKPPEAPALPPK